jgi:hypothetical protein
MQNTFWAIQIFIELIFLFDILVIEFPVTSTSILICLPSPAFHYDGKFIMQIPEVTWGVFHNTVFLQMYSQNAITF